MLINFEQTFIILGKPDPILKPNSKEPFLLLDAVIEALMSPEEGISGQEKAERWKLATKIYFNPKTIDLTIEEVAKIKDLIGKGFPSPLVVGQAWQMLEGERDGKKEKK